VSNAKHGGNDPYCDRRGIIGYYWGDHYFFYLVRHSLRLDSFFWLGALSQRGRQIFFNLLVDPADGTADNAVDGET
jgi:hypothetical protein